MFIKQGMLLALAIANIVLLSAEQSSALAQTEAETSDLSVASVREALASEHAAIAAHPKDPNNYIRLAYTLTDAGIGEQARIAAADATRVAPGSAFALSAQGWVLHHNDIGVDYGSGFDYDGAVRAYQRAIELDPDDLDVRQSLANLLEFDRNGVRYAPDAQLPLAIDAYRYVKQHQKVLKADVVDNLAIDLFYAGRYEDAIREVAGLPGTVERLGVILAATAASRGSAMSIAVSNKIQGDEQRRKDALNFAAEGLWNKRLYSQAADLLTASLPDTARGTALSAKIQLFRDLKPFNPTALPASDPRQPVQRLMELAFTGTLSEESMKQLVSRHSYSTDAAWSAAAKQSDTLTGTLLALMKQTGLPRVVIADILLGKMRVTAPADPGPGAPIRVQTSVLPGTQFFVVFEDGTWRIAAIGRNASEVGAQSLHLLDSGSPQAARPLLDWYYSLLDSQMDRPDPLSGDLFTRLWAPPARAGRQAPLLAAAALPIDTTLLRPLVPEIVRAREETPEGNRRTDLDLLLAMVYLRLQDAPASRVVTSRLLAQYPASSTALHLAGQSYELDRDWTAWKALIAKRLQIEPDDRQLLLESATEAEAEGDYTRARHAYQLIMDGTHSTPADDTRYAWLSLFEGSPDDRALAAAQQATIAGKGRDYQSLLTLACVNAARGNAPEAHQGLLDAMSSAALSQPDAAIWYGFGRIFEQYGVLDAAAYAYQRTIQEAGDADTRGVVPGGASASTLARLRLDALAPK